MPISKIVTLLPLFLILQSCSKPLDFKPGDTYGEITVGEIKINTRERLINDRRSQEAWLLKQLEKAGDASLVISGGRQLSNTRAFAADVGVNASSGEVQLFRQQVDNQLKQKQQEKLIADLENQKKIAQLRNDLENIKEGKPGESSTTEITVEKPDPLSIPGGEGTGLDFTQLNEDLGSLKSEFTGFATESGTGQSTFIDDFKDHLAFRDEVRNELNKIRLDDGHDIPGFSLFDMSLNASIQPANDTGAYATVEIYVEDYSTRVCRHLPRGYKEIYRRWLHYFYANLEDEARRELNRSPSIDVSVEELTNAKRRIFDKKYRGTPIEPILYSSALPEQLDLFDMESASPSEKMREQVKGQCPTTFSYSIDNAYPPLAIGPETPGWKDAQCFCNQLYRLFGRGYKLEGDTRADVVQAYAVTPRESAERISEVTKAVDQMELAFALKAVTGAFGANAASKYLDRRDALYNALRRQPLVVGFSSQRSGKTASEKKAFEDDLNIEQYILPSEQTERTEIRKEYNTVGWLIGPSFKIRADGKAAYFRHYPRNHTLRALLVLPVHWYRVKFHVVTYWRNEDGTCKQEDTYGQCTGRKLTYVKDIPTNSQSLTEILLPSESRAPKGKFVGQPNLRVGQAGKLMISGRNLWREPRVFLGHQEADRVEVLPGMRGLSATFEKVTRPITMDDDNAVSVHAHLWTATSEKALELGSVKIYPAWSRSNTGLSLALAQSAVVEGEEFSLNVVSGKIPDAYSEMTVGARLAGSSGGHTSTVIKSQNNNKLTTDIHFGASKPNNGELLEFSLFYKPKPGAGVSQEKILADGVAPYYASLDESKLQLSANSLKDLPKTLTITFPKNYKKAYPWFNESSYAWKLLSTNHPSLKFTAKTVAQTGDVWDLLIEVDPASASTLTALLPNGDVNLKLSLVSAAKSMPMENDKIALTK